jgi:hypothetical protein
MDDYVFRSHVLSFVYKENFLHFWKNVYPKDKKLLLFKNLKIIKNQNKMQKICVTQIFLSIYDFKCET